MTIVRDIAMCVACGGYATSPPTIGYSEHSLFGATWPFGYGRCTELHRKPPISNTLGLPEHVAWQPARACSVIRKLNRSSGVKNKQGRLNYQPNDRRLAVTFKFGHMQACRSLFATPLSISYAARLSLLLWSVMYGGF